MTNPISSRYIFKEKDFTESHSTQQYPLGLMPTLSNVGSIYESQYIYMKAPTNINAYQPYVADGKRELLNIDQLIEYYRSAQLVVPQFDMVSGEYGFIFFKGECTCLINSTVDGSTGDYLSGASANNEYLSLQGSQPDEVISNTYGFLLEPTTALELANKSICLLGKDGYL